jgi:cell cycle arrest protein BUB3
MEYFGSDPVSMERKYAFKCHRQKVGNANYVYPVNAIVFHPSYGTFATGGCDKFVNVWDGDHKKRVCQYAEYPSSISSLDFNSTGTLLAVASSYTFEEGEKEHPPDQIFVRTVQDADVKPKSKTAK